MQDWCLGNQDSFTEDAMTWIQCGFLGKTLLCRHNGAWYRYPCVLMVVSGWVSNVELSCKPTFYSAKTKFTAATPEGVCQKVTDHEVWLNKASHSVYVCAFLTGRIFDKPFRSVFANILDLIQKLAKIQTKFLNNFNYFKWIQINTRRSTFLNSHCPTQKQHKNISLGENSAGLNCRNIETCKGYNCLHAVKALICIKPHCSKLKSSLCDLTTIQHWLDTLSKNQTAAYLLGFLWF